MHIAKVKYEHNRTDAQGRYSASGAMGLIANPPGPVKNKLLSQNWRLDPFKL